MSIDPEFSEELKHIRREFHRTPELSGHERNTVERLIHHTLPSKPDRIIKNLGGNSLALVYHSGKEGPVVLFRADTDALPVKEELSVPYVSVAPGISHKCGHDGHMAILAGLARRIGKDRPDLGMAVLLFQAEEETGTGAGKVIGHPRFEEIKPDMAFALHNLPGFEKSAVVIRKGGFAAASTGVIIRLTGRPTHAGHPENGINPANAVAHLINFVMKELPRTGYKDFVLATIIQIKLGERAFGTAASEAEFLVTLRSVFNEDLLLMKERLSVELERTATAEKLKYHISYTEEFPATINDPEGVQLVKEAASATGLKVVSPGESFRWSEDFGHFGKVCPSVLFGLGAGTETPQLHNEDYDFPDDIIGPGVELFFHIYRKKLKL